MSKLTSLSIAAALLSTLALPVLAATPHHAVVKRPVHRVAVTATGTVTKPVVTAPASGTAKPAAVAPSVTAAAPATVGVKPAPAKPN